MIMPTKCKDCLKRINEEHQFELDNQKQKFKKQIKELTEQKQEIIKKEGYPASDVIAVLRKEIKQKIIEEMKSLEDFYYSKFGRSIISDFCKELLKSINSQETKSNLSTCEKVDSSDSSPDKTLGEKDENN